LKIGGAVSWQDYGARGELKPTVIFDGAFEPIAEEKRRSPSHWASCLRSYGFKEIQIEGGGQKKAINDDATAGDSQTRAAPAGHFPLGLNRLSQGFQRDLAISEGV